jgi:ABC-type polysaccharide/polyol phosphate transport system ATPase subunit
MSYVLQVDSVVKSFKIPTVRRNTIREHVLGALRPRGVEKLTVLDGISFRLEPGETVGIMGRNGCGKSTLLKIICGIYPPDRGSVTVRAGLTQILELGIGWNYELDAIDNVHLIGTVMGLSLREIRRQLDAILAFAELERFANLELKHFSSGMAARLAYAVAFHAVRDLLVLDEIFAVGDASFRAKCEARQRELHASGHTVLLVSHEPRSVSLFCDRALLLDNGAVVFEGTGPEVTNRYLELLAEPRS